MQIEKSGLKISFRRSILFACKVLAVTPIIFILAQTILTQFQKADNYGKGGQEFGFFKCIYRANKSFQYVRNCHFGEVISTTLKSIPLAYLIFFIFIPITEPNIFAFAVLLFTVFVGISTVILYLERNIEPSS